MEKELPGIAFIFHPALYQGDVEQYGLYFDLTKEDAEREVNGNNNDDGMGRQLAGFVEFDESSYVTDILKGVFGLERDGRNSSFGSDHSFERLLNKIFEAGVAEGKRLASQEVSSENRT